LNTMSNIENETIASHFLLTVAGRYSIVTSMAVHCLPSF
jgi:hypothetical protein